MLAMIMKLWTGTGIPADDVVISQRMSDGQLNFNRIEKISLMILAENFSLISISAR